MSYEIFLFALVFGRVSSVLDKTVAVVQIFRHGHRAPLEHYNGDHYSNSSFWGGLHPGELTKIGMRELYSLGKMTKDRYKHFLPNQYDSHKFIARSTDTDRSLLSAQCFLYGLFPAVGRQEWRKNLDWQPIPIHPVDGRLLDVTPRSCPKYTKLLNDYYNTDEIQKQDEENSDVLKFISTKVGYNYTTINSTLYLWDCLRVEAAAGFKLPDWANSVYDKLEEWAKHIYKALTYTTQSKRLITGPLLKHIVDYFDEMQSGSPHELIYQAFSGHDSNIAAILSSLGAYDPPYLPAFSSSIWFELKENNGFYYVNVWSKNGQDLKQISVNGCPFNCALQHFKAKISHLLLDVDTWSRECELI